MTIAVYLNTIQQQEMLVVGLDDAEVTELAKRIAFYAAMLDAAKEEPLDDPDHQANIVLHMETVYKELVEKYQQTVNRLI